MMFSNLLLLGLFITTSAFGNVSAYFNNNSKSSYTDPYRNISRRGDNLEQVILDEISLAKKSIYLAVQELRLPLIAKALIEKKNEGVDVRIVLEHNYNATVLAQKDTDPDGEYEASTITGLKALVDINRDHRISKEELEERDAIYMLQKAQVPVIDDASDSSSGSGLMHHKFMVIDGKTTLVSTANFTMGCIHGDILRPSSRGNANSLIVVQSNNFAKIFSDEFAQLWGNGRRGNFGHNKTYRGSITTTVKGTKITVQFSPTSQRYQWEESVNGLMASHILKAQRSIKAALFVFSDQNLADAIQERAERGAEIGVLIEPKFAYREYSELLDLMGIEILNKKCQYENGNNPWKEPVKEAGVPRLADGDFLHHKFAVIDGKTVIMGSQNWSDSANFVNDETLIVVQDTSIADKFTQEYNRLKSSSLLGAPSWLKDKIRKQESACADMRRY